MYTIGSEGEKYMRNITDAAEELSISRRTIYNRIEELNIKTIRQGKNSLLKDTDFEKIKERVKSEAPINATHVNDHVNEHVKTIIAQDKNTEQYVSLKEYEELKQKLENLESSLKKSYLDRIESLETQLKEKDKQIANNSDEIKGLIVNVKSSLDRLSTPKENQERLITLESNDYKSEEATTTEVPKKFWNIFNFKK
jgi:DNA repair exonuclease SbcCD ATPase subunit